jgi:transcriptional regulator with XRE-family HTH domain
MELTELSFYPYLRELRKSRGWTQRQAAANWGISPQYLNDLEHERREPGETVLKALGLRKQVRYVSEGEEDEAD